MKTDGTEPDVGDGRARRSGKRRRNGEGGAYPHARGGWYGQITVTKPDGTRGRKTLYGRTEAEVLRKIRAVVREQEDGYGTATRQAPTLAVFGVMWINKILAAAVRDDKLTESTRASYALMWRKHIEPTLGRHRLDRLSAMTLTMWMDHLRTKAGGRGQPLSNRTVAYVHSILRRALNDAVRLRVIPRHNLDAVSPPRVAKYAVKPLTTHEARAVLAVAREHRHFPILLVMLTLGLRVGEVLALRWTDVDLDAGTLNITRAVRRVQRVDAEDGEPRTQLVYGGTKVPGNTATAAMPAVVVRALQQHRHRQVRDQLQAAHWADEDLVFTSSRGTVVDASNVRKWWYTTCDAADIGRSVRIHDLRHSAASFMIALDVPMEIISKLLRHSRRATTADIYGHLLDDVKVDAASAMDGLLDDLLGG